MRRKIYQELLQWKQRSGESALLVQGARRVGKSYIVEAFAKAEYKSYILIDFNLVDQPVKEMFEHDLVDLKTFFMKLTTYYGVKLYERESLIILMRSSFSQEREALLNTSSQMDATTILRQAHLFPSVKMLRIS